MLPKDIFQKHQRIGIDIDETLAQSASQWLKKLHCRNKMKAIKNLESITSFDWADYPDSDMSQAELHEFWKMQNLERILPIHDSILGVSKLYQNNKLIHIITARNEHDHRSDTEKWLNIYFPEIHPSNIHYANHFLSHNHMKSMICKSFGITIIIDDWLHNALDVAEQGIECILIDKPWNRSPESHHPLIYRVDSWKEIIDVL